MGELDVAGEWRTGGGGTAFIYTGGAVRVGEVSTVGELAAVGDVAGVDPTLMRGKEITRWMEGIGGLTGWLRAELDWNCLFWLLCFWPWACKRETGFGGC